jgi:Spy/CpxP family protein refolding chaperone
VPDLYNARRYLRLRESLKLSPEQVSRLENLRDRYRARYEQKRNMIELHRSTVHNLRNSAQPDFSLIRRKMRDISELQSELRDEWAISVQAAYDVLTPAQRDMVRDTLPPGSHRR